MTPIVPVPAAPTVPTYPPLGSATFNVDAYAYGSGMPGVVTGIKALVDNAWNNATAANERATTADTQASEASASAAAAAVSASSALNAPGTSATSTTSLTVAAGLKAVVLQQTGKAFTDGQRVVIALAADPANVRMVGEVEGANPGTGALPVRVSSGDVRGSGTYANWVISMAGEGTAMPDPTAGNAGKVATVLTGGGYGLVTPRGTGGATATGNVTLTATSAAVQLLTPAGPGQWVQLADATTVPVGEGLHALCNLGAHDVEIRNALGVPLGYIQAGTTVAVSSQSAGSVAGAWCLDGASGFGVLSSEITFASALGSSPGLICAVSLDEHRELLVLAGTTAMWGVVFDGNTAAFGTPVLIRSGWSASGTAPYARGLKTATDQVLLVSAPNSTALQAVVLTITGAAISVGAAASATAAGSVAFVDDLIGVVGQGWVVAYRTNSSSYLRAMTISGTTVTIGAEKGQGGDVSVSIPVMLFDMGGGKVLAIDWNVNINITLNTLSGTTLTSGTGLSPAGTPRIVRQLASGRVAMVHTPASGFASGSIISVSGTVASISTATIGATSSPNYTFGHVIGNQLIFGGYNGNDSIIGAVTDNAGTAVGGTPIVRLSGTTIAAYMMGADASSVTVLVQPAAAASATGYLAKIGMSGNNPVVQAARYVSADALADGGFTKPNVTTLNANFKEPVPPAMLRGTYSSLAGLAVPKNLLWATRGGLPTMVPAQPMTALAGGYHKRSLTGNWEWTAVDVSGAQVFAVQRVKVA